MANQSTPFDHTYFGDLPDDPSPENTSNFQWRLFFGIIAGVSIVFLAGFNILRRKLRRRKVARRKVGDLSSEHPVLPVGVPSISWDDYLELEKALASSGWSLKRNWTFASPIVEYKEDHGRTGHVFKLEMPLWAEPCDENTEYWLIHSDSKPGDKANWRVVQKLDRSCLDLEARKLRVSVDEMCKYGVAACGNFKEDMMLLAFVEPSADLRSVKCQVFIERYPGDQQVEKQIQKHSDCRSVAENATFCPPFLRLMVRNCEVKLAFSVAAACDFVVQDPALPKSELTLKTEDFVALTAENSIGSHATCVWQLSRPPSFEHPLSFYISVSNCEDSSVNYLPISWHPSQQVPSEELFPRGPYLKSPDSSSPIRPLPSAPPQTRRHSPHPLRNETVNACQALMDPNVLPAVPRPPVPVAGSAPSDSSVPTAAGARIQQESSPPLPFPQQESFPFLPFPQQESFPLPQQESPAHLDPLVRNPHTSVVTSVVYHVSLPTDDPEILNAFD